jgi:hypothetical protein
MGNFMTAGTEIEGLKDKRNAILQKVGNTLAIACVERGREGKVNGNMPQDIYKLLDGFSSDEQVSILCVALTAVSSQVKGGSSPAPKKKSSSGHADYFANRGF